MLTIKVVVFCLATQVIGVFGSGVLEIQMADYTNTAATYGDNTLCDVKDNTTCDPYFTFCVDHFLGNDNPESCLYSMQITNRYDNNNDVVFGATFNGGAPNPFSILFTTLDQDHVMLKVDVWDLDLTNRWIDQFNVFIAVSNPAPDVSSAVWTGKTVKGARSMDKTSLTFQYRVYCDAFWYGSSCTTYCATNTNPLDGQFTCDPETGDKTCNPGWTDPSANCTVNINECDSSPCFNMGYCQDQVNGFRCVCLQGVNGTLCEDNLDECVSNPCLNGANCVDDFDGYMCECTFNYYGVHCEYDRPKV